LNEFQLLQLNLLLLQDFHQPFAVSLHLLNYPIVIITIYPQFLFQLSNLLLTVFQLTFSFLKTLF